MFGKNVLLLCCIPLLLYAVYLLFLSKGFKEESQKSVAIQKQRFYGARINDTISRIEANYHDTCIYSFWIKNYSMFYIDLNTCIFQELRQLKIGDKIVKEKNTNQCTFIKANGERFMLLISEK